MVMHGDPMLKTKYGSTKFNLKPGEETELLNWKSQSGTPMQLRATVLARPDGQQWFKTLSFLAAGKTVLQMTASASDDGAMWLAVDGSPVEKLQRGKEYASQSLEKLRVETEQHPNHNRTNDVLHIQSGPLAVAVFARPADKYEREEDRARFSHLNMNVEGGIPRDATGLLAEIAGNLPMSYEASRTVSDGRERADAGLLGDFRKQLESAPPVHVQRRHRSVQQERLI
tara:strand:- start:1261 stop:1944 length:684 start_codon:yes stop_codon:yes gene_type:complete